MTKVCSACRVEKPIEAFYQRRAGVSRTGKCKPCENAATGTNSARYQACKKYGITGEQYDELLARPCDICGRPENPGGKRLHIDHCHETGVVRGILCQPCNMMIGLAYDDPTILRSAAAYLATAEVPLYAWAAVS